MNKNALVISKRLEFPYNDRTDKNILAQPKMNQLSLVVSVSLIRSILPIIPGNQSQLNRY